MNKQDHKPLISKLSKSYGYVLFAGGLIFVIAALLDSDFSNVITVTLGITGLIIFAIGIMMFVFMKVLNYVDRTFEESHIESNILDEYLDNH